MGFLNRIVFPENKSGIKLADIKTSYVSDYDRLVMSVTGLLNKVENKRNGPDIIESEFEDIRNRYKRLEVIFSYYNHDECQRFVNAPPLPKLEKNSTSISILEPYGWQVMDESFCSGSNPSEVLKKNLTKVLQVLREIQRFQKSMDFEYRHLFEALKNEYLRIYTLTLTGFETPCKSGSSITLASNAWAGCKKLTEQLSGIDAFSKQISWSELLKILEEGGQYLNEHTDFDSFDRALFYKEYIQPAIRLTLDIHSRSGVETINEVNHLPTPVHYTTPEMFSDSFFNPAYFTVLENDLDRPRLVTLGKKLFEDPVLSREKDMSCSSCHQASKAFTDGEPVKRIRNKVQPRNTPTLLNSLYADKYFYDLRAHRILDLYDHILFNEEEFDSDYFRLVEDLERSSEYVHGFEEAFPGEASPVSYQNVKLALTAYLQKLTSWNSDFDRFMRGEQPLSPDAIKGFNLFMGKAACGTCHFPPSFSGLVPPSYRDSESEILGVTHTGENPDSLDGDHGRMVNGYFKEKTEIFDRSFKTPTVRNIAITGPYMHNGKFNTLEEVLNFYNSGGGTGMGFNVPHQTLSPDSLQLSDTEIQHLITFMESLTDTISYKNGRPY